MNGQPSSTTNYELQGDVEADDSHLDPRIYKELEKLNKASEEINCLEVELDGARAAFRQILNESISQLNSFSKKLGTCVDKARPYYDARKKALEAQLCTQNAAIKFEKACSQLAAAKEMVNLAEQGYFKMGQSFDPAWQEMLNHSTIRVNDAEKERLECEVAHKMTTFIFNEAEQSVRRLQKDFKRSISKSKPYFEMKAKYNQMMEDQKKKIERLESSVARSKEIYSQTLRALESISDEIHEKRGSHTPSRVKRKKSRRTVARPKRPDQIYHPLLDATEVVLEEVSSPSPEEKLVGELDALHKSGSNADRGKPIVDEISNSHLPLDRPPDNKPTLNFDPSKVKVDVQSSHNTRLDNIPTILRPSAEAKSTPIRRLDAGDAKGNSRSLYRPLVMKDGLSTNKLNQRLNILSPVCPSSHKDVTWTKALSPTKPSSPKAPETIFRAPLNPVRVESLSTERVSQEVVVPEQVVSVHDLIKNKESKGRDIYKEVSDERSKKQKHCRKVKHKRKEESSLKVQISTQCPERSTVETQKSLQSSQRECHPPLLTYQLSEDSKDSTPEEKQVDSLQQTSYSFMEKRDVWQQTNSITVESSESSINRKEASLQTSTYLMNKDLQNSTHKEITPHPKQSPRASPKPRVEEQEEMDSFHALFKTTHHQKPEAVLSPVRPQSFAQRHFYQNLYSVEKSQNSLGQDIPHEQRIQTIKDCLWKHSSDSFQQFQQSHFQHFTPKSSYGSVKVSPPPPPPLNPQLLPGKAELSQADANSETESIASSLNSASLLDDEQVESLMTETGQYHNFLSQMDAQESERYRHLTLPNKLHYLKNYVNFEPVWLDNYEEEDEDQQTNLIPFPQLSENQSAYESRSEDGNDDDGEEEEEEEEAESRYYDNDDNSGRPSSNDNDITRSPITVQIIRGQGCSSLMNSKKVTFAAPPSLLSINCNGRNTSRMAGKNKN